MFVTPEQQSPTNSLTEDEFLLYTQRTQPPPLTLRSDVQRSQYMQLDYSSHYGQDVTVESFDPPPTGSKRAASSGNPVPRQKSRMSAAADMSPPPHLSPPPQFKSLPAATAAQYTSTPMKTQSTTALSEADEEKSYIESTKNDAPIKLLPSTREPPPPSSTPPPLAPFPTASGT